MQLFLSKKIFWTKIQGGLFSSKKSTYFLTGPDIQKTLLIKLAVGGGSLVRSLLQKGGDLGPFVVAAIVSPTSIENEKTSAQILLDIGVSH